MRAILVAAWFLWAFLTPVMACSLLTGERVLTNVELIDDADLVVLAITTPTPGFDEENSAFDALGVTLSPLRILKGERPDSEIRAHGYFDQDGEPVPPTPTPLDQPHPSTLSGACIRQYYSDGAMVVAMCRKTVYGYRQLTWTFARVIEDVSGPDARWVKAASLYVKVLRSTDRAGRRAAFEAERARLLADSADPDARATAADIEAYLSVTSEEN